MAKERKSAQDVLDVESLKAISEAIKPQQLDNKRRVALRDRILGRIRQSAPAPAGTITVRADDEEWRTIAPLIEVKVLYRDTAENVQTALWRVQPGAQVAAHAHTMVEECLVLEGAIKVGEHYVRKGDMHIALPGHTHPLIESPDGALLLLRSEILDYSGSAL